MSTPLSINDVRRVARLSRLAPNEEELRAYTSQLRAILESVEVLSSLETDGVEPMSHPLDAHDRTDEDAPGEALPNETLMHMAPDTAPPFLKVPKVLAGGGGA